MALPAGSHPSRFAVGQDGVAYDGYGNPLVIASGTITLDGTNPTPVTTGLTTITGASVSFYTDTALGDDPNALSCLWSGGTLSIYAWKNASGTDPTQVASTSSTAVVSWIAHGT